MVTYSKKRRDQELTAANCIAPDLCEKIVASVSTLAVDFIFFIDEKIFTVAPPGGVLYSGSAAIWSQKNRNINGLLYFYQSTFKMTACMFP